MPDPIVPSPGQADPTSGTPSTPSPGQNGATSDNDQQVAELRRRLTEQAEEMKELRTLNNTLAARVTTSEPAPTVADAPKSEDLFRKGLEDFDGDTLAQGIQALRREIAEEMDETYGTALKDVGTRTTDSLVRTFFVDKEAPEMAQSGSAFWKYVGNLVNKGGSEGRAVNILMTKDIEAGLDYAWDQFVAKNGDPAAERRKRIEVERRKDVSIERGSGIPTDMTSYVIEDDGPKRRNLVQLRALLKAKGALPKD